ncbi:calcium-binding protein [Nocardioides sp. YIM 152315]|uniref:calcium-binding protein n=1 Tax=Nocardioides sp. YIM 152315 TaxID=3031760 RepID=UPI0023DA8EEA|nr:calcium-binding protein [Nocardioides sp. YIM 152315]MDF1602007.1 calcium-binding protein [Nocardioides sp. YIM 152315]
MTSSRSRRRAVGLAAFATLLTTAGVGSVAPSSAADTSTCRAHAPTIVASAPGQTITGTDGDDVIIAWGFADVTVNAGAGNDLVCGNPVSVDGGDGNDAIVTVGGTVVGGAGNDAIWHTGGTTDGGPGNDLIEQRQRGTARGDDGRDTVAATIYIGAADPLQPPWESATVEGDPVFDLVGGVGRDLLTVSAPTDGTTSHRCPTCDLSVDGGDGRDTIAVRGQRAKVHLKKSSVRFAATRVRARDIENVIGTSGPDVIVGDDGRNTLSGKGGRDRIFGGRGGDLLKGGGARDVLIGQRGLDGALGGGGNDKCRAELAQNCE